MDLRTNCPPPLYLVEWLGAVEERMSLPSPSSTGYVWWSYESVLKSSTKFPQNATLIRPHLETQSPDIPRYDPGFGFRSFQPWESRKTRSRGDPWRRSTVARMRSSWFVVGVAPRIPSSRRTSPPSLPSGGCRSRNWAARPRPGSTRT